LAASRYNRYQNEWQAKQVMIAFEVFFAFHMLLQFFKEYSTELDPKPVKQISQIALHYLKTWHLFPIDFVTLIPL
jgi:hypothetical protein